MYKRFVALLMAVLMAVTAAPVTVFAGPSESHGYSQGYIFNEETQFCWLIFYGHIEPETTTGPALRFVLMFNEAGACAECKTFFHTLNMVFSFYDEYFNLELQKGYLRARSLNPRLGRFTQADPHWSVQTNAIFGDSPLTRNGRLVPNHHAILQSGNLFVYVMNDPVNWIDPSGLYGIRSNFGNISTTQFNSVANSMNVRAYDLRNAQRHTNLGVSLSGTVAGFGVGAYISGNPIISLVTGVAGAFLTWGTPMPGDVLASMQIEMAGLQERHQYTDHTFQISILNGSHSSEILVNVVDGNNQIVETMFFESRYGVILSEVFNIVSEIAPEAPTIEVVETGFSLRP